MNIFGSAVILAGGKSKRMGFDKQLMTVKEGKLIEVISEELFEMFDDVAVVTNKPALYEKSDIRILTDEYPGMGPLAGIQTALKHSKSRYIYLLACDMPVICRNYIQYMMDTVSKTHAQVCVTRKNDWIEPFNAFYSVDLLESSERRLKSGDTSVFRFIDASDAIVIPEEKTKEFNTGTDMFTNLNTEDAYLDYLNNI